MNSCPPKPSSMPFVISIILLLMVIVGMLVYFFMFHEPSQEVCANLYTSNICTTATCDSLEVCPTEESVEWKPKVSVSKDKFLGHSVNEELDGTFGTAYNTGLTSLMSEFDSNVCTTLTSMDKTEFHPLVLQASNDSTPNVEQIDCIKMISKLDSELAKSGLTWLEKSKLLEVRHAVIEQCTTVQEATAATPTTDAMSASRVYKDTFLTTELSSPTGAISKIFCPTDSA